MSDEFIYAGQTMRVLAELDGFAAIEVVVPPHFAGPVPHRHHAFDEAIYVVEGSLTITLGDSPREFAAGQLAVAQRGQRHTFTNPHDTAVKIVGLWSPGPLGVAFMKDLGAAIPPGAAPDPETIAEVYRRHDSELLP